MALMDLLNSFTQSPTDNGGGGEGTVDPLTVTAAARPAPGPDLSVAQGPATSMDFQPMPGAVSQGTAQTAQPPGVNYNNSMDASALSGALGGEPALRGGSANPGVYGLLPQSLQHGTLRNMLGALGDAFLVGTGHQAQYGPRMQRQEIGQAMAGYNPEDPQSVQAAIQRIAATGASGSTEMADQMQKNYNDVQLRKQVMQQNQNYHQQTIQARNDNLFNRMNSVAQADLAQATSPTDYQARLGRWDQRVKAIDPSTDATTQFGVPSDYTPGAVGSTSGMTNQQITQSNDRAAQRAQSGRNTDVNANSRIGAARISSGSRNYATDSSANKPTSSTILQSLIDKKNLADQGKGPQLTSAEQATFNHMTQTSRKGATLPPGLTPSSKPVPTASDHAYARAHPEVRAAFQAHFGVAP